MEPLVFVLLLVAMPLRGSDGAWCVCRPDVSDAALQKTLDYACGHGADCAAVLPTGPCYSPTTVRAHCSYAANSYFQQNSQANGGATCDFGGTANLTDTDPSSGTCKYPATPSEAGTSGNATGTGTAPPGSTSNPATTPSMGGSVTTTPVGAFGPAPSTFSAATATAAAFGGRRALLLAVVSVLSFLAR
ncbi:hypothetical protein Zm00014a_026497 [Zea mays]|uniref:Glucan endo-1,3-beta-glucosidase 1 n=2 Tax=Zea mays TaxID=4577 RepID=B6TW10_MAIZE|nr:glucan endo-1,3-beta-glucosidase 1 precursor [Zea mays]ACG41293.1 glucan endo-1,3-beta-glucosidase 1 precursor [Zea mays]ACR36200.1 unknown [Zea mays]ONM37692.1 PLASMODESMATA CALLOSE-BINDING PROTEIN 2 [Zea mays]PWZ30312.1 hypothetical protein Zm00014a_026497 [Zea mays]|eukprot:NP_001151015.1 glucan endo-1,3-beta-glucosidase 1 precursor [Zea mays]